MKIPAFSVFWKTRDVFCRDGYQPSVTPDFNKYPNEHAHHL